jgi:hypothetical protein
MELDGKPSVSSYIATYDVAGVSISDPEARRVLLEAGAGAVIFGDKVAANQLASALRSNPVVPGGSVGYRMDASIQRLEKAGSVIRHAYSDFVNGGQGGSLVPPRTR